MITGINHITLSVHDLEISLQFYSDILGCHLLTKWDKGAYLLAGNIWLCLSLDTNTKISPSSEYTHIAFNVATENVFQLTEKIIKSGATIWKKNSSEGDSLYFLDPNGHKLEIHATSLADRLVACKEKPYTGMVFYDDGRVVPN